MTKLRNPPIIETIAEIRFKNERQSINLLNDLLPGLAADFQDIEQLPILSLPQNVLDSRDDLKFLPHYRLKNKRFIVNVGKNLITVNRISTEDKYESWDENKKVIDLVLGVVDEKNIAPVLERVSLKYINFFEDTEPVKIIDSSITLGKLKTTNPKNLILVFNIDSSQQGVGIRLAVRSDGQLASDKNIAGTILDIEAFIEGDLSVTDAREKQEILHGEVERCFFEVVKQDFINGQSETNNG